MVLRSRLALLSLTLASTAFVGCGRSDDTAGTPSARVDQKAIISLVTQALEPKTPGAQCRLSTPHLVTEIWGSRIRCEKNTGNDWFGLGIRRATVKRAFNGRVATVNVVARQEGRAVAGTVQVTKVGSNWRLEDFGDDFLRSLVSPLLAAAPVAGLPGFGSNDKVSACLANGVTAMPSTKLRAFGYALLGNRLKAAEVKQISVLLYGCLVSTENGRRSLLRLVDQQFRERRPSGVPDQTASCAIAKVHEATTSERANRGLRRLRNSPNSILPYLARLVSDAARRCA
jgi:hypothetical protein